MLLLLLACKTTETVPPPDFLIAPLDLGTPLASGTGLDPAATAELGVALWAALPIFGENPAFEMPADVEALWHPEVVQDEGICPYSEVLEDGTLHRSDCRSTDGYEFNGTLERRAWSASDGDYLRLDADFEVVADVEGADFGRILLRGSWAQVQPDQGSVVQHLDINLHMEVEGYWELHKPTDPRLEAWKNWTVSGSLEQHKEGGWLVDMSVDVGGAGGFLARSSELKEAEGCPVEMMGELLLSPELKLIPGGLSSCDRCVDVVEADVVTGQACAP